MKITLNYSFKGPIAWARLARLAGLAQCTKMTTQPGITWGGLARLRLNLEAVVWKDGNVKEHEPSVFFFRQFIILTYYFQFYVALWSDKPLCII